MEHAFGATAKRPAIVSALDAARQAVADAGIPPTRTTTFSTAASPIEFGAPLTRTPRG